MLLGGKNVQSNSLPVKGKLTDMKFGTYISCLVTLSQAQGEEQPFSQFRDAPGAYLCYGCKTYTFKCSLSTLELLNISFILLLLK